MARKAYRKTVIELLDGDIKRLREEGYTLSEIAKKGGVTKERIRQVISQFYPGTKPRVYAESKAASMLGISTYKIGALRKQGLIHPKKYGRIYRYDKETLKEVRMALSKPCRICGNPIPSGKLTLCDECSAMMKNPSKRLKLPGEREKYNQSVNRWNKEHKEQSRLINKKSSSKFQE